MARLPPKWDGFEEEESVSAMVYYGGYSALSWICLVQIGMRPALTFL